MTLYAATLRLVFDNKPIAELQVNEWTSEYKPIKPVFDGSVQFSVESLSDNHITISDTYVRSVFLGFKKEEAQEVADVINETLETAYNQGVAAHARSLVNVPQWGNK